MNDGMGIGFETVIALSLLGLAPFILTIVTSFAKLMVVGSLLRQAIGTQQTPPNSVIAGIALVLSLHIMAPVVGVAVERLRPIVELPPVERATKYPQMARAVAEPLSEFLIKNSSIENRELFLGLRAESSGVLDGGDDYRPVVALFTVDAPAFLLTELGEAFQIGFLLFVPFLVIDLVVTNILLAVGASMLTPTSITLPLKLLLFVLADGWRLVLFGLTRGYA